MILQRRRKRDSFLPWVQLGLDLAAALGVLHSVFWLRFASPYFPTRWGTPQFEPYFKAFLLITLLIVYFMREQGLYKPAKTLSFSEEAWRIVKSVVSAVILLMAVTFFIRGFTFSRMFLVLAGGAMMVGLSIERFLFGELVSWLDHRRGSLRNVLVIGCDESARKLSRFYKKNRRLVTQVIGYLDDTLPKGSHFEGEPVLGKLSDVRIVLRSDLQIHEVILARQGLPTDQILSVIDTCEKEMVTFRCTADLFGLIAAKMSLRYYGDVSLLSFTDTPLREWENRAMKRILDIVVSATVLILFLPLFAVIAALVKTSSKGPVFYGQLRIGEDGRRFALLKFRTMSKDAEKKTGPVWASENDPRRTRIGGFLRRTNLDELPQFWNVLKGDMSLVGPRPERPFFVSRFKNNIPRYMARHTIRSGITGWAQVNGLRGNTSIEERTKFDLYYIENWSILLDMKILMRTFWMTVFARNRNAY